MTEAETQISHILQNIRSGKIGRDKEITQLYNDKALRNKIKGAISKLGGNNSDFEEIFNETLMRFIKGVIKNKELEIDTSVDGYLLGIARFVHYDLLRSRKKHQTLQLEDIGQQIEKVNPETLLIDRSKVSLLQSLLNQLGKNCREVLMQWGNGYSMKEIAVMMNYKSDMMAKKKKYKCFKQLLNYLEEHPEIKNVLK